MLCEGVSLLSLRRLSLSIRFAVSWTDGAMFEFPGLSEGGKFFAGELWPIVGYNCIWTSISGEVVLEFQDDGACLSVR